MPQDDDELAFGFGSADANYLDVGAPEKETKPSRARSTRWKYASSTVNAVATFRDGAAPGATTNHDEAGPDFDPWYVGVWTADALEFSRAFWINSTTHGVGWVSCVALLGSCVLVPTHTHAVRCTAPQMYGTRRDCRTHHAHACMPPSTASLFDVSLSAVWVPARHVFFPPYLLQPGF